MARRINDRYVVTRVIGHGGNGTVWEGSGPGGPVAIKQIESELTPRHEIAARFENDSEALLELRHRNIVSVRDVVISDDDEVSVVMDLVAGTTLRRRIAEDAPLTPQVAVVIARDIASALTAAHAAGLPHRDLKPENVLLTSDDSESPTVLVTDFGITSLVTGPLSDSASRKRLERSPGAPEYLAPEIVEGCQPNAAVDIYALGVTLFEMLAGTTPFGGGQPSAVLRRHVTAPVPPLPGLPEPLREVIESCLSKAPAARLTARELTERLEDLVPELADVPALPLPSASNGDSGSEPDAEDPTRDPRVAPVRSLIPLGTDDGDASKDEVTHLNLMKPVRDAAAAERGDQPTGPSGLRRALTSTIVVVVLAAITAGVIYLAVRDRQRAQQVVKAGSTTTTTVIVTPTETPGGPPEFSTPRQLPALPTSQYGALRPVLATGDHGGLYVFLTGTDGSLWYTVGSSQGTGFGSWHELTGLSLAVEPAVVEHGDQIVVIALDRNGALSTRTITGGTVSGDWQAVPSPYWHPTMTGAPGAALLSNGSIALVVATADGGLVNTTGTPGHWQGWSTPSTDESLAPGVAVAARPSGGFDVYAVRRADHMVLDLPYTGSWQTASPVDATSDGTPQGLTIGATRYVFVRSSDGGLDAFRWTGSSWQGSHTDVSSSVAPGVCQLGSNQLALAGATDGHAQLATGNS